MELYEAIRSRRSIRAYRKEPIPEEVLRRVLDATHQAPSANNVQPWKFIVVKDEKRRRKVAEYCWRQEFIAEAPVVVVGCGLGTSSQIGGYASSVMVDVAIAMDHLSLAARTEGLGSCWIGAFDNEELKKLLAVPEDVDIVAVMPIGYPVKEIISPGRRKHLSEVLALDTFDKAYPLKDA